MYLINGIEVSSSTFIPTTNPTGEGEFLTDEIAKESVETIYNNQNISHVNDKFYGDISKVNNEINQIKPSLIIPYFMENYSLKTKKRHTKNIK